MYRRLDPPYKNGVHALSFYVELYEPFLIIVSGTAEHTRLLDQQENGENHIGDPNVDSSDSEDENPDPWRRSRLKNSLFIIYLGNQNISKRLQISGSSSLNFYNPEMFPKSSRQKIHGLMSYAYPTVVICTVLVYYRVFRLQGFPSSSRSV